MYGSFLVYCCIAYVVKPYFASRILSDTQGIAEVLRRGGAGEQEAANELKREADELDPDADDDAKT
jgi:hypothetical protein